jgi:hypothetical protein
VEREDTGRTVRRSEGFCLRLSPGKLLVASAELVEHGLGEPADVFQVLPGWVEPVFPVGVAMPSRSPTESRRR